MEGIGRGKTSDIVKVLLIFDTYKKQLSREQIHSLTYILDRLKVTGFPKYRYLPYRGIYSLELQNDVDFLVSLGNLNASHSSISYQISGQGSRIMNERIKEEEELKEAYEQIGDALNAILKKYQSFENLMGEAQSLFTKEIAKSERQC